MPKKLPQTVETIPGLYNTIHRMTFSENVTREEVMEYVISTHYFNYHPAGYGGILTGKDNVWNWEHSNSCD